ncbi:MAG TPA: peptidylprolyl isomerase [Anaerolineae bacterium]|nr:peptidylprolyl isomerase [Anaerolineae bacterium]HQK15481.1 peptidylprolyl isomerase [Anaerolineae bacterium]
MNITSGKVVHIHYTLTDDAGELLDTSAGQEPLAYLHGAGNLIPGLENALEGKTVGDTLTVVVPPEEGYGLYNADLVETVLLSQFPDPSQVEVGVRFGVQAGNAMYIATVTDIEGDRVTFDMNHPLAGVTLHFDVAVVGVEDATPEELAHGHVHAPEGH